MKRILYLGGFELPDKNAAAQRVMANALLLREMGYEVSLVGVVRGDEKSAFEYNGFSCRCLKYPNGTKDWLEHVISFMPGEDIVAYKPDYIILYNFPAIASLRILNLAHKHGIKVIHDLTEWEHTSGVALRDIVKQMDTSLRMRYCMKKMDGIIAISRYLFNLYKDDVNTILVPPTVDLNNPKWNRSRELRANTPITLVYAGSPGVGVKDRLDLIVDEVRNYQNMRLVVVGINEEQFYDSFNRKRALLTNIEFKGRLPHIETVKVVCDADFQMLIRDKNRKNDAGFPTKLVESMSCGTPVIATVFSNITDYIKDGVNGFLVNGDSTIEDVLKRVSALSAEEIITMKQNCIDLKDFDYRHYQMEFGEIF